MIHPFPPWRMPDVAPLDDELAVESIAQELGIPLQDLGEDRPVAAIAQEIRYQISWVYHDLRELRKENAALKAAAAKAEELLRRRPYRPGPLRATPEVCALVPGSRPKDWRRHPNGGGWVYRDAHAELSAYVGPRAMLLDRARALGGSHIGDDARVRDDAIVGPGTPKILGRVVVGGYARVQDEAVAADDVIVGGSAILKDRSQARHAARIVGTSVLSGDACIGGATTVDDGFAGGNTLLFFGSLRRADAVDETPLQICDGDAPPGQPAAPAAVLGRGADAEVRLGWARFPLADVLGADPPPAVACRPELLALLRALAAHRRAAEAPRPAKAGRRVTCL